MKISNNTDSILAYLKSLFTNKETKDVKLSKDNLEIIINSYTELIRETKNLKSFLIQSHNSKEYSLWLKNNKLK